jgi:hypothetical protein
MRLLLSLCAVMTSIKVTELLKTMGQPGDVKDFEFATKEFVIHVGINNIKEFN